MIKFSIIIPSYNNLDLFKNALCSVSEQDYNNYETVVVDDSTNTDIENYISTLHDTRISYYHNIPSKGPVKNWNYGIQKAKGLFIIVLHHDEAFDRSDYLSILAKEATKGYNIIISTVKVYQNDNIHSTLFPHRIKKLFINHPILLFLCNVIGPCACLTIKRNIVPNFCEELHWLVDVNWYYDLLHKNKALLLPKEYNICSFNDHKDKITNNINIKETEINDYKILIKKYKYHPIIRILLFCNKFITVHNLNIIIKRIIRK